jgi:hypothetical protein
MPDTPWFVQPIATLIASFTGAGFAFLLAERRVKREETNRQIAAVNRAVIVLFSMYSNLENYRKEVTENFVQRDDAWLNAPVVPAKVWTSVCFDSDALAFLLQKKQPNLYAELLLCECNFEELCQLIQQRDDIMLKQAHPALNKFLGRPVPEDEVHEAIGRHVAQQLKQLWDGINKRLLEQIESTKTLHDKLRDAAVQIHPGRLPVKGVFFDKNIKISHDG